ncbi:uncharacterized protein LOC132192691 [Neocloeon triangulifer]|uniref:uncharacterized protein LOC132192691 n=1 Tax=Neocloeon triangulifer TaxID=2078957 RepID=UPI00286EC0FE|nr:uncharacterized protein LOC132192691 [Neocloeon triangulifer]
MLPRVALFLAAVAAAAQHAQPHVHRQPIDDDELIDDEFAVGGPQCPPSVRPVSKGLCHVQKCYTHAECHGATDGGRLCCYNGCVYSCMLKMPPPLVFDWIDDESREMLIGSNETFNEEPWSASHQQSSSEEEEDREDEENRAEANAAGHVIALPEGCILTKKDFEQLLAFQQKDHVDKCYCKDGEVFCKVHGTRKT